MITKIDCICSKKPLRKDHQHIRRLEKIVDKCQVELYAGRDIPFSDIEKITIIISEFLDSIHYSREEDSYFACVASYGNLHPHHSSMTFVLWMTGLPCSGKTTIVKKLQQDIPNLAMLDGDELREWLSPKDFSKAGRDEHNKKVAHLAKLLLKHKVPVAVSLVSPYIERKTCHP